MKKILIIQGHPDTESFCYALANAYSTGATASGATVKQINIGELNFKYNLQYGYRKRTELEPCLLQAQELIWEADHLVFIHPVWWGSLPAVMKAFLDRIFLPGFFFRKHPTSAFKWEGMLKNKSARIIYTLDTPRILWWLSGRPSYMALKYITLKYCGIKPVKGTSFGIMRTSKPSQRTKWLQQTEKLGRHLV